MNVRKASAAAAYLVNRPWFNGILEARRRALLDN